MPTSRRTRRMSTVLAATTLVVATAGRSHAVPGSAPSASATQTSARQASYSRQVELPFGNVINHLAGVAVDNTGNVYVSGTGSNRVLKLEPGDGAATVAALHRRAFALGRGRGHFRKRLSRRRRQLPRAEAADPMRTRSTTPVQRTGRRTGRDVALPGQAGDRDITFYETSGSGLTGPALDPALLGADWENECEHQSIRRRRC